MSANECAVWNGAKHIPAVRVMLIDDDLRLAADAASLAVEDLALSVIATPAELDLHLRREPVDVVVICLDLPGAFEALERLCADASMPAVIAIASRGRLGTSLEYTLTLGELRGAALSLPKPIDASELACEAVKVLARRRTEDERLSVLAARLEKLTLF